MKNCVHMFILNLFFTAIKQTISWCLNKQTTSAVDTCRLSGEGREVARKNNDANWIHRFRLIYCDSSLNSAALAAEVLTPTINFQLSLPHVCASEMNSNSSHLFSSHSHPSPEYFNQASQTLIRRSSTCCQFPSADHLLQSIGVIKVWKRM